MAISKKLEEELRKIHIPSVEEIISGRLNPGLDEEPWMKADIKWVDTQDGWILIYNEAGKVMASAADYYRAAKFDDGAIASLQEDSTLMTSTRILYNKTNLKGNIVHYYGSTVAKPVKKKVLIPDYSVEECFKDILDSKEGLGFAQALFLTDDNKEEILETLNKLSSKKTGKITIRTPSQKGREKYLGRAVSLLYIGGDFLVDAWCRPNKNDEGYRSHKVLNPALR